MKTLSAAPVPRRRILLLIVSAILLTALLCSLTFLRFSSQLYIIWGIPLTSLSCFYGKSEVKFEKRIQLHVNITSFQEWTTYQWLSEGH